MYNFNTNLTAISNELLDTIKLFFYLDDNMPTISHFYTFSATSESDEIEINSQKYFFNYTVLDEQNDLLKKRFFIRRRKTSLYKALIASTRRVMPWGSLTGVRPTKLCYELLEEKIPINSLSKEMQNRYFISEENADILERIIANQEPIIERDNDVVNLYIHIPFCPSRCYYCSFVSTTIDKQKKFLPDYISNLKAEIVDAIKLIEENNYKIGSIYIGGGTPTSIDANMLKEILRPLQNISCEFTLEAGRPDTIDKQKLDLMQQFGVNRISINPQTFSDDTLKAIGRNHTIAQFYEVYELAKAYPFDINIDLIAGLKNETLQDFSNSIICAEKLAPQNITVHTLSRKNGASLTEQSGFENDEVTSMVSYSKGYLLCHDYEPYYLYRQKHMLSNLENIGYSLHGKECYNNINVMEERSSVIGCGAGAISKRIFHEENRIERLANLKDVKLYNEQFEQRLTIKQKFFSK